MPLPYLFASVATITTPQLDANFQACAILATLPCVVSGTNTVQLTLMPGTPTLSAYGDYLVFSGVFAATNTASATAQVGALGTFPVYKGTAGGPALLSGGEQVIGNSFLYIYDAALNGGSGGFHLNTGASGGGG